MIVTLAVTLEPRVQQHSRMLPTNLGTTMIRVYWLNKPSLQRDSPRLQLSSISRMTQIPSIQWVVPSSRRLGTIWTLGQFRAFKRRKIWILSSEALAGMNLTWDQTRRGVREETHGLGRHKLSFHL